MVYSERTTNVAIKRSRSEPYGKCERKAKMGVRFVGPEHVMDMSLYIDMDDGLFSHTMEHRLN